jgi:hypothetical protein
MTPTTAKTLRLASTLVMKPKPGSRGVMRHLPAIFALAVVVLASARAMALPVGGCPPGLIHTYSPAFVTSPTSGTAVDSTQSIPLALYVPSPEGYINVYARNWAGDFAQALIQTIKLEPRVGGR